EQGSLSEIVHCHGAAVLTERVAPMQLDIRQLCAQMQVENPDPEAPHLSRYKGSGQQLLRIRLPEAKEGTQEDLVLHPILMESALRAAIDLLQDSSPRLAHSLSPVALGSLKVLSPCASGMYVWARYARGSKASDDMVRIDLTLIDEENNVCVVMKALAFDNCSSVTDAETQRIDFERMLNLCSHAAASASREHRAENQAHALEQMLEDLIKVEQDVDCN
ncbi:MAG: hypothetical protein HC938_15065, partial [Nitrospira sp.]|nr:hypothetical protein [Nitrospira sp.]